MRAVWFGERIIRKRISENFRIFCCVFEASLTQYIPDNFSFIFFQNCRAGAQYFVSKPTGLKGLPDLTLNLTAVGRSAHTFFKGL